MKQTGTSQNLNRRSIIAKGAVTALIILSLANVLNYADRVIISVVGQAIKQEFSLSDTQLSLLTGPVFITVYILASLFFGWLSDRASRRKIVACIVAIWSLMTIASGFTRSFGQILIARAGVGVGEGGSSPAAFSLIADYFPPQRRSIAIAVFNGTGMLGILLAFLAGGYIAHHYGWRSALIVAGVPGLLLAPVIWFILRDPERGAMDGQTHESVSFSRALRMLMQDRPWVWLLVGNALGTFCNLGILQWLPIFFIRAHDLTVQQVGLFFGPVLTCGMITGIAIGGWLGDRLTRHSMRRSILVSIVVQFAIVPIYWAALWAGSLPLALGCTFVAVAAAVTYSPSITAALQTIPPSKIRGTSMAVFNFANGLFGQALLPFAAGVLSDTFARTHGVTEGLRLSLTVMIAVCWIAGLMLIRGMRMMDRQL